MELWKPIHKYTGYYVSSLGRVKSIDRLGFDGRLLKGKVLSTKGTRHGGYPVVCLSKNSNTTSFAVHRLVAKYFIPNPLNKPQVNHIDGVTKNARADNLEWVNNSENQIHACIMGLKKTGEKSHRAKLSDKTICTIRGKHATGKYTQKQLATMYNVTQQYISRIINHTTRTYQTKD